MSYQNNGRGGLINNGRTHCTINNQCNVGRCGSDNYCNGNLPSRVGVSAGDSYGGISYPTGSNRGGNGTRSRFDDSDVKVSYSERIVYIRGSRGGWIPNLELTLQKFPGYNGIQHGPTGDGGGGE